jgi:hypothetical protein
MKQGEEYINYMGIRMIVKRRFEHKTVRKIELLNPKNNNQFVINEYELTRSVDQTIKQ